MTKTDIPTLHIDNIENFTKKTNSILKKIKPNNIEAVISASKFLDLLLCVFPAASNDPTRKSICGVELELIANEYAIRAAATNGQILSVAQRELGFSNKEQNDLEDIEARNKVKNTKWLISTLDADLLIIALKKLGVKRSKQDNSDIPYYISIEELGIEGKQKLNISILGLSHVVLEPDLVREKFPEWKSLVPRNAFANIESIAFDLDNIKLLNKCWGQEKIFMSFFSDGNITKINRNTQDEERIQDLIVLMPMKMDDIEKKKIDNNQMNLM